MLEGLETRLDDALGIAREMGSHALGFFRDQALQIDVKTDGTIVTQVDRETERLGCDMIHKAHPGDSILGEEHGLVDGDSPWRWVVDPIDGTVSFTRGVPSFGVLVGLEHEGVPVGGVVHLPALNETAWGGRELGAFHQLGDAPPSPARVSSTDTLEEAMVCTTSFDYFRDTGREDLHDRLVRACGSTRGWSDCSAVLLLATGRIDAVVEPLLSRWDICAPIALIEAAGGKWTDFKGQADPGCSAAILSNGHLHEAMLELVKVVGPGAS